MIIEYASKPPTPAFNQPAPHLESYGRVYELSQRAAQSDAECDLAAYLKMYEDVGARHVVVNGCDRVSGRKRFVRGAAPGRP